MDSPANPQPGAIGEPGPARVPRPSFPLVLFLMIWLLVTLVTVVVTLSLPKTFASSARIRIERDHTDIPGLGPQGTAPVYDPYFLRTELGIIQSELLLDRVIEDLNLNREWGRKFGAGSPLKTWETRSLLRSRMDVHLIRNTSLAEIRVSSGDPAEAARIANGIADSYRTHRQRERVLLAKGGIIALEERYVEYGERIRSAQAEMVKLSHEPGDANAVRMEDAKRRLDDLQRIEQALSTRIAAENMELSLPASSMVQIVERAMPGQSPVRPNVPCSIFCGVAVGGFAGLALATLVYLRQMRGFRRRLFVARS